MILVISGTNMPGTRVVKAAREVAKIYQSQGASCEVIDLSEFNWGELNGTTYFKDKQPKWLQDLNQKTMAAKGVVMMAPEYNGSYPGILKLWIDHWQYPEAFKNRNLAIIGLGGGQYGGLRPADHLAEVFAYGESFVLPRRAYIRTVDSVITKEGQIVDEFLAKLLVEQAKEFLEFVSK